MTTVQREALTTETDPAKLEKLPKKDLVEIITTLQRSTRQEQRQSQWGSQFDMWLIKMNKRSTQIACILSNAITDPEKMGEAEKFASRKIVGVPRRVDKYEVQFETADGSRVWVNKSFIVSAAAFNQSDEEE